MTAHDRSELIQFIAWQMAHGSLRPAQALPLLEQLRGDTGAPTLSLPLIETLRALDGSAAAALRDRWHHELLRQAHALHAASDATRALPAAWCALVGDCQCDVRPGWDPGPAPSAVIEAAIAAADDHAVITRFQADHTATPQAVDAAWREAVVLTNLWRPEFDIWASVMTSVFLTGSKQYITTHYRDLRVPLMTVLLVLPAATIAWVVFHHMGSTAVLIVAGLHSLLFAYLGKDERESPYQVLSVCAFATFVLVLFWAKLSLRVVHAYVIPTGVGLLTLVHVFRDRLARPTRNAIRASVVIAMIGSAGYYALLDDRFPALYLATFALVCFGVMFLGAVARVHMYALLGFVGLAADLGAIVYKVAMTMERNGQMIMIGGLVLLFGVVLVTGAIYAKTQHAALVRFVYAWRLRLRAWD